MKHVLQYVSNHEPKVYQNRTPAKWLKFNLSKWNLMHQRGLTQQRAAWVWGSADRHKVGLYTKNIGFSGECQLYLALIIYLKCVCHHHSILLAYITCVIINEVIVNAITFLFEFYTLCLILYQLLEYASKLWLTDMFFFYFKCLVLYQCHDFLGIFKSMLKFPLVC